ncbi:MAG: hypothetical protein QXM73_02265 [Candidatus Nezhaarchaeales archaeon]
MLYEEDHIRIAKVRKKNNYARSFRDVDEDLCDNELTDNVKKLHSIPRTSKRVGTSY